MWAQDPQQQHFRAQLTSTFPAIGPCFWEKVHLFTDGTLDLPKFPTVALASWSVVLATPNVLRKRKVWAQHLHGDGHSINRAELMAILACVMSAPGGDIYTDSAVTYLGYKAVQRGTTSRLCSMANGDLWFKLWQLRHKLGDWAVHKVKCHVEWQTAPSDRIAWESFHNDYADHCAKEVNAQWPATVRALQAQMLARLKQKRENIRAAQALHTHVATMTQPEKVRDECPAPSAGDSCRLSLKQRLGVRVPSNLFLDNTGIPYSSWTLCPEFATILVQYLKAQQWIHDEDGFTLLELYMHSVASCGWIVPINVSTFSPPFRLLDGSLSNCAPAVWIHEHVYPNLKLCRQPLYVQLQTFRQVLLQLTQFMPVTCAFSYNQPYKDLGLRTQMMCLSMRPRACLNSELVNSLRTDRSEGSLYSRFNRVFHPKACGDVWPCQQMGLRPRALWLARKAFCKKPLRRLEP